MTSCVCGNDNRYAWVGRRKGDGTTVANNFGGLIDEVSIWDSILSDAEISSLYTNVISK